MIHHILFISLCLYSAASIRPCPAARSDVPASVLTFDSGQCFKGSALCPLPFDLTEVYFYNCLLSLSNAHRRGCRAKWGEEGLRLSTNLLASCPSILLEATFSGRPPHPSPIPHDPQSHTVLVCMLDLLMVLWKYFIGQS